MSKEELPLHLRPSTNSTWKRYLLSSIVTLASLYLLFLNFNDSTGFFRTESTDFEEYCPQLDKLVPQFDENLSDLSILRTDEYKNKSVAVWGDAVRIRTENFDDLGEVGEDPRWDIFYKFREYLENSFPAVTSAAKIETVNTHGLVYTIKGSNEDLKPLMLCGHQDVVPVPDETLSRWKYPPFAGVYDGEYLWGRGSNDCKNNVVSIFESLELLFTRGFKPERTILLAFGFDEETSGGKGASKIGEFLTEKLGEKSVFMIVDEGGLGIQDINGGRFALPATGEKGYLDVNIDLATAGGHSSVPPRHTSIGMIAEFIREIEKTEYPLDVSPKNPFFYQLQCEAKSSTTMSKKLRKDISKLSTDKAAKKRVLADVSKSLGRKALISTTQAVDIINGGLKINALPEKVTVKINHRVSYESSVEKVQEKILKAAETVSAQFGLDIFAFGKTIKESEFSAGFFNISATQDLGPAPLTTTINNPTWDVFGGTIRHVFEDFSQYENGVKEITVSPSCMTGNTDTRHYWSLTDNIYRFTAIQQEKRKNAHTVNERVQLDSHIDLVAFFYELIRNADSFKGN